MWLAALQVLVTGGPVVVAPSREAHSQCSMGPAWHRAPRALKGFARESRKSGVAEACRHAPG